MTNFSISLTGIKEEAFSQKKKKKKNHPPSSVMACCNVWLTLINFNVKCDFERKCENQNYRSNKKVSQVI